LYTVSRPMVVAMQPDADRNEIDLMKILLRDSRKKLFFRQRRVWTSDPEAAFDFHEAQELYNFVKDRALNEVQAVLVFDNPYRCEVVPLNSAGPEEKKEAA